MFAGARRTRFCVAPVDRTSTVTSARTPRGVSVRAPVGRACVCRLDRCRPGSAARRRLDRLERRTSASGTDARAALADRRDLSSSQRRHDPRDHSRPPRQLVAGGVGHGTGQRLARDHKRSRERHEGDLRCRPADPAIRQCAVEASRASSTTAGQSNRACVEHSLVIRWQSSAGVV